MEFMPTGELLKGLVEADGQGYVVTSETTESGIPGLFVAGDVRRKALRQVVTAAADGAVAAQKAGAFVRSRKNKTDKPSAA
jgi:thioredoxin reductase (NADPH)